MKIQAKSNGWKVANIVFCCVQYADDYKNDCHHFMVQNWQFLGRNDHLKIIFLLFNAVCSKGVERKTSKLMGVFADVV